MLHLSSIPEQYWLELFHHILLLTNTSTKLVCNAPISPSQRNQNWRCKRRLVLGVISMCSGKNFWFKITLKLLTQVAARQLKDRSFEIFGALTENALSTMMIDEGRVRMARQQFFWQSQWCERDGTVTNETCQIRWTSTLPCLLKSKLRACSRCIAPLVANGVYSAVLWHCMFSQLGIQLWPNGAFCHVQLLEIITGRAVEERVAVDKAHGHNAKCNHLCRFQH